jgi:hypothetical protein
MAGFRRSITGFKKAMVKKKACLKAKAQIEGD